MRRADQSFQRIKLLLLKPELIKLGLILLLLLTQKLLLFGDLLFLCFDLFLLLFDGVDQHGSKLAVFHSLDFALRVARRQQRFDLFNLFGGKANIPQTAVFPVKSNRAQPTDDVETA